MRPKVRRTLRLFLLEAVVYAALVAGYYLLVLHLLGDWLSDLFHQSRPYYAAVALALIIGQGILLDIITHLLVRWFNPQTEAE